MFRLIKYEYRRNLVGVIVMLGGVLAAQAYFLISIVRKDLNWVMAASSLLMLAAFLCGLGTLIYSVALYSRELNQKSSYLTFMTPNSVVKILGAKLLAALFLGVVFVALLGSFATWDISLLTKTFPEFEMSRVMLEEVLPGIVGQSFATIVTWIAITATGFLINFYTIVMLAYLAITLSATVLQNKKIKGLISFLIFVALMVALQWGVSKFPQPDYYTGYTDALLSAWPQYVVYLFVILGSFSLSAWMLDKKVSL